MAAIQINSLSVNQVEIDGTPRLRSELVVTTDAATGKLHITKGGGTLVDMVYSNVIGLPAVQPFASFADMQTWVMANVHFNGHRINAVDNMKCYLLDGKPYAFDRMYFAWDDVAETLEVRLSPTNYQQKPLPPTHYSMLVPDDNTEGFGSYSDMVDYITSHCFTPLQVP